VWFSCTQVYEALSHAPLESDDRESMASWSDGTWIYTVFAPTPELRSLAIDALALAVRET
jgi:hypothetical protein